MVSRLYDDVDDVHFYGVAASTTTATKSSKDATHGPDRPQPAVQSTCRTMQRKLEMKVFRAKNSLTQINQHEVLKKSGDENRGALSIMPISRMRIPGHIENLPLVDCTIEKRRGKRTGDCNANDDIYDDVDDDDDDDDDDIEFYPMRLDATKSKGNVKHELSDTFSLQEMTIMGTDDDDANDDDDDDDDDDDATNADVRTAGILDDNGQLDDDDDDCSQTLEFLTPKIVGGGRARGLLKHWSGWTSWCCWNKRRI